MNRFNNRCNNLNLSRSPKLSNRNHHNHYRPRETEIENILHQYGAVHPGGYLGVNRFDLLLGQGQSSSNASTEALICSAASIAAAARRQSIPGENGLSSSSREPSTAEASAASSMDSLDASSLSTSRNSAAMVIPSAPPAEDSPVHVSSGQMSTGHLLLDSEETADLIFIVGPEPSEAPAPTGSSSSIGQQPWRFPAHSFIIDGASPIFTSIAASVRSEEKRPVEKRILNAKPEVFKQMLRFIYTQEIQLTSVTAALELLRCSHQFAVHRLTRRCVTYCAQMVNPDNVMEIIAYLLPIRRERQQQDERRVHFGRQDSVDTCVSSGSEASTPATTPEPPPFSDGPPDVVVSRATPLREIIVNDINGGSGSLANNRCSFFGSTGSIDDAASSGRESKVENQINELLRKCYNVLDFNAEYILLNCEYFENCQDTELIKELLDRDTLRISSETVVLEGLVRWASQACKRNRRSLTDQSKRQELGDLLYLVRFGTLTLEEFRSHPYLFHGQLLTEEEKMAIISWLSADAPANYQLPDQVPWQWKRNKMDIRRKYVQPSGSSIYGPGSEQSAARRAASKLATRTLRNNIEKAHMESHVKSTNTLNGKNGANGRKFVAKKLLSGIGSGVMCLIRLID